MFSFCQENIFQKTILSFYFSLHPARIGLRMSLSLLKKIETITTRLGRCSSQDDRYQLLIAMGRTLPPYPSNLKTENNRVPGCQSILYLSSQVEEERTTFQAHSEALISAGLAALLIEVYQHETPETILAHPPAFLEQTGIAKALSIHRSNGLFMIYKKMREQALNSLLCH
jgi:cysteine desulfuration protein SufE